MKSDASRRNFLRATGGTAAAVGVTAAGTRGAAAQSVEWPSQVTSGNLGSEEDARGQDEVTVIVGAGEQGLAFSPTKLWIDPGTTVTFEWAGQGGSHNVETIEGPSQMEADLASEEGYTYEYEFTEAEAGITAYQCNPHKSIGMFGGIAVGDDVPTAEEAVSSSAVFVPDDAMALSIASFIAMCGTLGLAFVFMKYGN
ncbi:MAG: plastocyanin [Halorubrum sp. J07HR59]|jgi:halocyanin domain|nr:MAG: plastocyanin [Halorubrum sp. J07HR59]